MASKIDWAAKVTALSTAATTVSGSTLAGINAIKGKISAKGPAYDLAFTPDADASKTAWLLARSRAWGELDRVCRWPATLFPPNVSVDSAFPKDPLPFDASDRTTLDARVLSASSRMLGEVDPQKWAVTVSRKPPSPSKYINDAHRAFFGSSIASAQAAFDEQWRSTWDSGAAGQQDRALGALMSEADLWLSLAGT